jgi:hypothetical protein
MIGTVLGIDFDNTIVCYDEIFYRVAMERKLIPADIPPTKEQVRDYLRRVGREDEWTEMQGYVYGSRMMDVQPFPGVMECIAAAVKSGFHVAIISHKTRSPYLGHPYDLHAAARDIRLCHSEQQGRNKRSVAGLQCHKYAVSRRFV